MRDLWFTQHPGSSLGQKLCPQASGTHWLWSCSASSTFQLVCPRGHSSPQALPEQLHPHTGTQHTAHWPQAAAQPRHSLQCSADGAQLGHHRTQEKAELLVPSSREQPCHMRGEHWEQTDPGSTGHCCSSPGQRSSPAVTAKETKPHALSTVAPATVPLISPLRVCPESPVPGVDALGTWPSAASHSARKGAKEPRSI